MGAEIIGKMGRSTGFEPATPRITILCSNQLSYDRRKGPRKSMSVQRLSNPSLGRAITRQPDPKTLAWALFPVRNRCDVTFVKITSPPRDLPLSGVDMISFKKLMGKDEKFYDLLEASAEEARVSTDLLVKILRNDGSVPATNIHDIIQTRRKDKRITQQITEELCKTFVTPLEREDIEALSLALYRIPKTVEKIVERLTICPARVPRDSLTKQVVLLEQAVESVVAMVGQLRKGNQVERIADHHAKLQFAEGEADKVMLALVKDLYNGPYDAKEVFILMELYDLVETAVDRARDAGQVVFMIMLKYA
jgi:uncharacterized protein Yka (UPF0111/DUF47 family)